MLVNVRIYDSGVFVMQRPFECTRNTNLNEMMAFARIETHRYDLVIERVEVQYRGGAVSVLWDYEQDDMAELCILDSLQGASTVRLFCISERLVDAGYSNPYSSY